MAHRKHHHSSSRKRKSSKNIINKTISQTVSVAKSTSKKYMPKVKTSIENIGSKVILFWNKATPINWGNIISIIGIIGFIYLIYLFFKSKSK